MVGVRPVLFLGGCVSAFISGIFLSFLSMEPKEQMKELDRDTLQSRLMGFIPLSNTPTWKWNPEKRRQCEEKYKYPSKNPDFAMIEAHQLQRQKTLQDACKKQGYYPMKNIHYIRTAHLLVNDDKKTIFCFIPKVACTTIQSLLKKNPLGIQRNGKRAMECSFEEFRSAYRKHFRFLFVRDPWSRLLSCFRSKFPNRPPDFYYRKKYGQKIIRQCRPNATEEEIEMGMITFEELLRYITGRLPHCGDIREDMLDCFNDHWTQFYELCRPCQLKYDFIGRIETLFDDLAHVFNRTNLTERIPLPSPNDLITEEVVDEYYRDIPPDVLKAVYETFKWDFELFGYDCLPF